MCSSQNPGKRICTAPRSNLPRTSCSVSFTIPSNAAWIQSCHSDVSPWYTRLAYEVLPTAISEALDAKGFFAHPYHSWERGLNENTNGLIRQYLPKGKSFDDLTDQEVEHIMDRLNNRPRKCLGFRTPNQVFFEAKSDVALAS